MNPPAASVMSPVFWVRVTRVPAWMPAVPMANVALPVYVKLVNAWPVTVPTRLLSPSDTLPLPAVADKLAAVIAPAFWVMSPVTAFSVTARPLAPPISELSTTDAPLAPKLLPTLTVWLNVTVPPAVVAKSCAPEIAPL